jgi:PPE-repeat protein
MAAAAATDVKWMTTTADQAEQTGAQARAAAAAFEAAFAMHVPPPVIAANRSLLATLAAPNFLGQNTPAIMATEADYMEMWAQNAAAMYGYADASAAAATLTPFTPPAVSEATGSSVGSAHTTLSQLTCAVPTALQRLALPAASTLSTSGPSEDLSELSEASSILQTLEGGPLTAAIGAGDGLIPPAASVAFAAGILANAATPLGSALGAGAGSSAGTLAAADFGSGAATAVLNKATLVGSLSVPQAWAPAISSATAASPGRGLSAAPVADAAGPGGLLGGLPRTGASVRKVIPPRGYTG